MLSKFKDLNATEKVILLVATAVLLIIVIIFRNTLVDLLGAGFRMILGVGLATPLIMWLMSRQNRKKQIFLRYEETKAQLRQNPNDLNAREAMLKAGREYYASLRKGTLSIYDEQAIANDMNAINNR
jgi:hypothetical protein